MKPNEKDYEKLRGGVRELYRLKVEGYTDKNIAKFFGISAESFRRAISVDGIVKDTYESAMEVLAAKLMNVVVGRALGTDGQTDKDGRELPPDHNLAFRLLEKIDPRFKQKEEQKALITIEQVVRHISQKEKGELEGEAVVEAELVGERIDGR